MGVGAYYIRGEVKQGHSSRILLLLNCAFVCVVVHVTLKSEVGNHDGAYKGHMHSHTPFIGRKVLTKREREYNNVHGY